MNIPCPYNEPCIDDANSLGNYSSEDPDRDLFRATYFPNQIWNGPWDIYLACDGYCVSTVSQAEADLCAANNAEICLAGKLFGNASYTCTRTCPDGLVYSFNVPYGTFWATTQAQADALARNWCNNYLDQLCAALNPADPGPVPVWRLPKPVKPVCNDEQAVEAICPDGKKGLTVPPCTTYGPSKEAANERARSYADKLFSNNVGCLTALPKGLCVNDYISRFVVPDRVSWINAYPDWEVFGSVPAGWKWRLAQGGGAIEFYGTATAAGIYTFRVTATTPPTLGPGIRNYNAWVYRVYTISVMEIDEPAILPSGVQYEPYSHSISTKYGWDPKTFYLRANNFLHAGLSLSTDGVISGTPTEAGTKSFWVVVRDAEGAICEKKFTLTILPAVFTAFEWNCITAVTGGGVASCGGSQGSLSLATSIGTGVPNSATADLQLSAGTVQNNSGQVLHGRLTVQCNPTPCGTQNGSDVLYLENDTLGLVIANELAGTLSGTYQYDFNIPEGSTDFIAHFGCTISPSVCPPPAGNLPGGTCNWTISFNIIP